MKPRIPILISFYCVAVPIHLAHAQDDPISSSRDEYFDLASAFYFEDKYGDSEMYWLKVVNIALMEETPAPSALQNLAKTYDQMGRYADAIAIYRKKIDSEARRNTAKATNGILLWPNKEQKYRRKRAVADHFSDLSEIAKLFLKQGDLKAAEHAFAEVQGLIEEFYKLPDSAGRRMVHPDYRVSVNTTVRAALFVVQGNYDFAIQDLQLGLENAKKWNKGAINQNVYSEIKQHLGRCYLLAGKVDDARELIEEVLNVESHQLVDSPDILIQTFLLLATVDEKEQRPESAELRCKRALERLEKTGELGYRTEMADVLSAWARVDIRLAKLDEARQRLNRAIDLRLATQGAIHPDYGEDLVSLASIEALQDNYTEAERKARQGLEVLSKELVPDHPRKAAPLAALAALASLQGKGPADQTPEAAHLRAIGEKPLGPPYASAMESIARYAGLLRTAKLESDAVALESLGKQLRESPEPSTSP